MLEVLRRKVGEAAVTNVDVLRAGCISIDRTNIGPLDAVYTRDALHHLPDSWKAIALDAVHRLLRPGGLLRLWDVVYHFEPVQAPLVIGAWRGRGGDDVDEAWSRAELEEHVRDEHAAFTWPLEPMIERCGFVIETVECSTDRMVAKYVARKPPLRRSEG